MKDLFSIVRQIGHILWYRMILVYMWFPHAWHRFLWGEGRICKEEGCGRPLLYWLNGKYCICHSRSHRAHTVLVVAVPPKDKRLP